MADDTQDTGAQEVVIQLLRVLSEIDVEALGDGLRQLDTATTRRAMTGASLLAEALTRATLGSDTVAAALGTELTEPPVHVPHRERGVRVTIHDDEAARADDSASEA
ncbi:hypothetical protein AB4028_09485 [Janibacter sp. RAF20_2_2]|uniref:hypothetical protein n=1 Tax=Janibacter TaxID=53457 RepID=UPI00249193FF|nr:hypothetical protein [Janibacter hoylei]